MSLKAYSFLYLVFFLNTIFKGLVWKVPASKDQLIIYLMKNWIILEQSGYVWYRVLKKAGNFTRSCYPQTRAHQLRDPCHVKSWFTGLMISLWVLVHIVSCCSDANWNWRVPVFPLCWRYKTGESSRSEVLKPIPDLHFLRAKWRGPRSRRSNESMFDLILCPCPTLWLW